MTSYKAPLQDYKFLLDDVFSVGDLLTCEAFSHVAPDVIEAVLEEAAKLCEGVLLPLNQVGDKEGCRFHEGKVTTAPGFPAAHRQVAEGGWLGLTGDPEYGGQGLPHFVGNLVEEMMCSTNLAYAMYRGLTEGACRLLGAYASAELKDTYIPRLLSGEWLPTMNLTEPHCGSDLGLLRSKAVPAPDGSYRITGTKIFISGGEQDLTDNIIHLVLARLPDAPAGTRGISVFLVPKKLPDAAGKFVLPNQLSCGGIEHKMGMKGSATCLMNFEEATGFMVGPENSGLKAMFTMMNAARLAVSVQGVAIGEAALQIATAYAAERRQGRAAGKAIDHSVAADTIDQHPDVKRMLLTQRAYTEGGRALSVMLGRALDLSHVSADAKVREAADDMVQLLTPVAKSMLTECGFDAANLGIQILGGHGYISEWGIEQLARDVRVSMIYEGTNGIQAGDLAGRKLHLFDGRLQARFFADIETFLETISGHKVLAPLARRLALALNGLRSCTDLIMGKTKTDPAGVAAVASDFLRQFGLVTLGYLWLRMALVAGDKDEIFYCQKIETARFFITRLLTQTLGLEASIQNVLT